MSDYVISVIRTVVPAAVGLILAQLLKLGIEVDAGALTVVIDGVLIGAWYAVARWIESNVPWLSWINGIRKQPSY